ncbi:XrtA/PEP-CTERM system TPR-repeat protein PrsT [Pseudoduganella violacea]|uniref:Putative PEP-CTERM system TPR-repeat lipoprotein n=1 Tax=Pseudoduganella violacea TaxID=1715466 RepID=A0A7W5B5Q8_9BURK|nr:XrtA/PEP-CTERM system TPR-repeat protein PrsT [Pseudoduganella violacea]MBB3117073.1 putative PEP-CTERM system TPR-repeat lipoprotein [Pseudoduganella violacea]
MSRRVNKLAVSAALMSGVLLLGAGMSACSKGESAEKLLADARQYQQKGDHKAALIQLKNALEKSPDLAEARFQLASLYNDLGEPLAAEKEIRRAIALKYPAEKTTPVLARTLLMQGEFQKVLDETANDKSEAVQVLRGDAYLSLGADKAAQAEEAFQAALKLRPNSGEALVGLARVASLRKDLDGAIRFGEEAVSKDPQNPAVWSFKGDLLRFQDKPAEALAAYQQVVKLKPDHRSAHLEIAYLLVADGKYDAAQTSLDAARKLTPNNFIVLYTQALLDYSRGKYTAAQENLLKVLRVAPNHMPTLLLAGAVELNTGSVKQAEQYLRKYLEANPDNVYARKMLAGALLKSGQAPDALSVLGPALKGEQQDASLLALAGETYMQARDFDKATSYFSKATVLDPQKALLRTSLGLSKLAQGDKTGAVAEMERAAALDSSSLEAGLALLRTELGLEHFDKALQIATELEKKHGDRPVVHNTKGGIYLAKKDLPKARASFEKALSLDKTYLPSMINLAQIDLQDRKFDLARQRFDPLLQKDPKNVEAMTALANIAVLENKPEVATNWLIKAATENPDALAPALQLAVHYMRGNEAVKAVTLLRKYQVAHAASPELLDVLGQAQLATKDQAGALETFSKLASVMPKSAVPLYRIGVAQQLAKNEAAAVDSLKKAVALDADYLPAYQGLIGIAVAKRDYEQALTLARQVQKQQPKQPPGYLFEGDIYEAQQKPAQALVAYEKALTLSLGAPNIFLKIHNTLRAQGKEKEAAQRLAQWRKDKPDDFAVALLEAEGNIRDKNYKLAATQLEALQKKKVDDVIVLNNLAWVYQQLKDPRALAVAEHAYKLQSSHPSVVDTLGWLLIEQGNTTRGIELLRKAIAAVPDERAAGELRYHLAYGLHKSGDKAGARKELEKLLASGAQFPQLEEARSLLKQL